MLGVQGFDAAIAIASYVRERTAPGERIFVYGSEPEIAFTSERRDVNPFGLIYPLTWTWPRHREFQERVWAEIERWRPTYIILARIPFSLVRSPAIDSFFEDHLTALAERAYRFEAAVVADSDGRVRFTAEGPDSSAGGPDVRVLYELWRRLDGEPG
jgi:hypothetical protein